LKEKKEDEFKFIDYIGTDCVNFFMSYDKKESTDKNESIENNEVGESGLLDRKSNKNKRKMLMCPIENNNRMSFT